MANQAASLTTFSRQWLQLHRVGMFPPDKKLYPTYDAWLEDEHACRAGGVLSARCS